MRRPPPRHPLQSEQQIPVHLISGFLGTGKTTLLRGLLAYATAQGLKPAVIMNEYGDVSIDGELLQGQGYGVTELSNGCICCTLSVNFIVALQAVAERRPDVIYIETTGLSDPIELIEQLTSLALLPIVQVASVIAVLDPRRFARRTIDIGYQVRRYTEMADLIIINKIDLATDATIATLVHEVRQHNNRAEVLLTTHGRMDFAKMRTRAEKRSSTPHHHPPFPIHNHVATFTYPCVKAFAPERFETFLHTLPDSVWRAKGFVRFARTKQQWLVQYDGEYVSLDKVHLHPAPPDHLVFIGQGLDHRALVTALDNSQAPESR